HEMTDAKIVSDAKIVNDAKVVSDAEPQQQEEQDSAGDDDDDGEDQQNDASTNRGGLVMAADDTAVPLESMHVTNDVRGFNCCMTMVQVFRRHALPAAAAAAVDV